MKMKIEKLKHTVLGHTVAHGFGLPAHPVGDVAHSVEGHVRQACLRHSQHAQRDRGGEAGPGSPADKVWRGRQCEHRGGSGNMPEKVAAVGAHPSGGSTVRCDGGGSTVTSEAVEVLWGSPAVGRRTYSTDEPWGR
jgi:hypothetical protein